MFMNIVYRYVDHIIGSLGTIWVVDITQLRTQDSQDITEVS